MFPFIHFTVSFPFIKSLYSSRTPVSLLITALIAYLRLAWDVFFCGFFVDCLRFYEFSLAGLAIALAASTFTLFL